MSPPPIVGWENFTISLPFLYQNSISQGQVNGRAQIAPGRREAGASVWGGTVAVGKYFFWCNNGAETVQFFCAMTGPE